jgi:hypothetical protein
MPVGSKIPDAKSPGRLNVIPWALVFVGVSMKLVLSLAWRLEFRDDFYILRTSVHPWCMRFYEEHICTFLNLILTFFIVVFNCI